MVTEPRQGFFSLVRWRADEARDEERNIGVMLLDPESGRRLLRPLPVSSLSTKLREQGILDAALTALRERFESTPCEVSDLEEMHNSFTRSLLVSQPRPVAVTDTDETLRALYRAFVQGAGSGPRSLTKGVALDRVTEHLRGAGWRVKRGAYIQDFIFDLVVDAAPTPDPPQVMSILSFGSGRKDWSPIEKDAGHFLCGLHQLGVSGTAAIFAPSADSSSDAKKAHQRVRHMFDRANVDIADAAEILAAPEILAA